MRKDLRLKAWVLLLVFLIDIFSPLRLLAGSGPSQPEMATFTPFGTTEMVDPFTGDFSYNIPLMDVEGYPINIAYNSGVTMEQEASWVGLGWNLNVGTVNRSVRGLPDDFSGDKIHTKTNKKQMNITTAGSGALTEFLGIGGPSTQLSFIHNNYKGFGISYSSSVSASVGPIQTSAGVTINSLDGTSVNSSLGVSLASQSGLFRNASFGGSLGSGFNTRTGQTMLTLGTTAGYNTTQGQIVNVGSSTSLIPIGMITHTPIPSFKLKTTTNDFSGTLGGQLFGLNGSFSITGTITKQELIDKDIETPAYGYIYAEAAKEHDLKDFNREKEVVLNKTINNLPPANFTYDVFSVSGQGVSGSFRPFRNDVGVLTDPSYAIVSSSSNSFGAEVGAGNLFKGGLSYNSVVEFSRYGMWRENNSIKGFAFHPKPKNTVSENVYFKAGGDMAESDLNFFKAIGEYDAFAFDMIQRSGFGSLSGKYKRLPYLPSVKRVKRSPRSKVFKILTAEEASEVALDGIKSTTGAFYLGAYQETPIDRVNTTTRKAHHISEITQINPDGERYVFGIPAYNIYKKEVIYNTDKNGPYAPYGQNRIEYNGTDASPGNKKGVDHYYSETNTPAYAHSFLLTAKLSSDYQDMTGDGISPDDIGTAHKFSYTKTSSNYKWRTPYKGSTFLQGYRQDGLDQKGSFTYGEKELWYLHTIQSKNQVAEFYISERKDGLGAKGIEGGKPNPIAVGDRLFQLDSIVLFDKLDRLKNKANAIPLKKIAFEYDYSLCQEIENHQDNGQGKLTLKKIEITHGRDKIGKQSPYEFTYSNVNPDYNPDHIDRWGNYKPTSLNPAGMTNGDFPYVPQNDDSALDLNASAWSLIEIKTPSGGSIHVEYEADDYAYIQDQPAMQMFTVHGAGNSIAYNGNTNLYENDYLYIKRPSTIPSDAPPSYIENLLFGPKRQMDNMYFKFLINLKPGNFESVSGYVTAEQAGVCPYPNSDYMYVKLKKSSPNAISRTSWGFFRQNMFEVLYNQPNVSDNGIESVVRGIAANMADIKQLFSGVENYLKSRSIAKQFVTEQSFIRLYEPTKSKKGGGSRVKNIFINDNWNELSGEGENSTYGQEYIYSSDGDYGQKISNGVASYEPLIGNDENPYRQPVPYIAAASAGHIPAIEAFQERPFGESFFPSAVVGYSKVIVRNIHRDNGKTAKSITEHHFYTAKDFPLRVKETTIQKYNVVPKRTRYSYPFSNEVLETLFSASQGYSIVLNDMHGKPLSTYEYMFEEEEENGEITTVRKMISGQKFNYKQSVEDGKKILNNKVKVLRSDGIIKDQLLGVEFDVAIENRHSYEQSQSMASHINTDGFIIPIPFPNIIIKPGASYKTVKDIKDTRYQVLTKVIQEYGIIESVESFTDQFSTIAYNTLYDGTTGEVLLTETKDEHKQNEFQYSLPAYFSYGSENLGPAYKRIGTEFTVIKKKYDVNCNPDYTAFTVINPRLLKHGDEVVLKSESNVQKAWVVMDTGNVYRKPIDLCNIDTVPKPPEVIEDPYIRLLTISESELNYQYDSIQFHPLGKFKRDYGDLLPEVNIFRLNTSWADQYRTSLFDSTTQGGLIDYNSCKIGFYNGSHRSGYGIGGHSNGANSKKINHIAHSDSCEIAQEYFYNVFAFSDDGGSSTIFDSEKNYNLTQKLSFDDIGELDLFFNLSDTLHAEIENLEAIVALDTVVNVFKSSNSKYHLEYPTEYKDYYRFRNSPCIELSSANNYVQDGNCCTPIALFQNVASIIQAVSATNSRTFTGSYRSSSSSSPFLVPSISNPTFYYNQSQAFFKIKDKQGFHQRFSEEQLYLVEYRTVNTMTRDTTNIYFIERGHGFKEDKLREHFTLNCENLNGDNYDFTVDLSDVTDFYTACDNNFRLIDRNGGLITPPSNSTITIHRPAERNQIVSKIGSMVANKNPMKVDGNGRFSGFLDENDLNIINANALLYKETHPLHHNYTRNSSNPFILGTEGALRADSNMYFMGSRTQSTLPYVAKDGYAEELPELWAELGCYRGLFPPDFTAGGNSSGWKYRDQVVKYNANGQALESMSNLAIPNSQLIDFKGNVLMAAFNSKHQNMAFDGFENYYRFGNLAALSELPFGFIQSTSSNPETLLNVGNEKYRLETFGADNLVKGVAHTGDYSMFVNRSSSPTSIVVKYKQESLSDLAKYELSNSFMVQDSADIPISNVTNTRNAHRTAFISNLSSGVITNIDAVISSAAPVETFTLNIGDTVVNFTPDSGEYLVSVWVKELLESGTPYIGMSPEVKIVHNGETITLTPEGPVIDGWQKIEGKFEYKEDSNLDISFVGGIWGAFFDDFRIHKEKSSAKTYVYDKYSNRLKAILDENNYATLFEYDAAGIPTQVKRETEEGILTVSESRQSLSKK